jgi:hypothetical protein
MCWQTRITSAVDGTTINILIKQTTVSWRSSLKQTNVSQPGDFTTLSRQWLKRNPVTWRRGQFPNSAAHTSSVSVYQHVARSLGLLCFPSVRYRPYTCMRAACLLFHYRTAFYAFNRVVWKPVEIQRGWHISYLNPHPFFVSFPPSVSLSLSLLFSVYRLFRMQVKLPTTSRSVIRGDQFHAPTVLPLDKRFAASVGDCVGPARTGSPTPNASLNKKKRPLGKPGRRWEDDIKWILGK